MLICGNENGAHAFAGITSSLKDTDVRVLNLYNDETERWSAATQQTQFDVTVHYNGEEPKHTLSNPRLLTERPENTIRDVNIVVLMLPRSAHQLYLEALRPHIKPGAIIVGLPGYAGFAREARHILGEKCTIMNLESEPWLCRIIEFGVKCEVHRGTIEVLLGTMKVTKNVKRWRVLLIDSLAQALNTSLGRVDFLSLFSVFHYYQKFQCLYDF